MGFLDAAYVLPQWMLLVGAAVIGILLFFIITMYQDEKKYCPEKKLLVKARKTGTPIIEIIDIGSNQCIWELGEKSGEASLEFKTKMPGIRVDPILTSVGCEPRRLGGALIYSYAYESFLPQTSKNHLAFKNIIRYKNEHCQDMDFLTDLEFITLISSPHNHLAHDSQMFISKYFMNVEKIETSTGQKQNVNVRQYTILEEDPATCEVDEQGQPIPGTGEMMQVTKEEEVNIPEFVRRVEDIKGDIAKLPLVLGYFTGNEAFKNNANGYMAQDLETLLSIHDKQNFIDFMKKFNIMIYAIAAAVVIGASGVAVYVVSLVKH